MTCIEVLALVQTIVSFATLLALVWYAWETRKIRLDAARQNELLRQQVKVTQDMFRFEQEREIVANEPDFMWQGGGSGPGADSYRCDFRNIGAAVQQVTAETETGTELEITKSLDAGACGRVEIRPYPKEPFRFKVHYTTKRQERRAKYFVVTLPQNPKEIAPF